jgi:hypothetical protein
MVLYSLLPVDKVLNCDLQVLGTRVLRAGVVSPNLHIGQQADEKIGVLKVSDSFSTSLADRSHDLVDFGSLDDIRDPTHDLPAGAANVEDRSKRHVPIVMIMVMCRLDVTAVVDAVVVVGGAIDNAVHG